MGFKITADTPIQKVDDDISIVSGPGGCPWVVSESKPHLGGNFDGGDLGTMYPDDLWPWLIETFAVETMVDVGCGTGETLRWFSAHGCEAYGVEGLRWNAERCWERGGERVVHADLCDGPMVFSFWFFPSPADLIWCADVAEHIPEEHVDNLLQTLRQCRVLAMCQGTEANADDGWGHVNNQPEQYWVDKLASVGMVEDVEMTARSREVGNHGWWRGTGRIYRRKP